MENQDDEGQWLKPGIIKSHESDRIQIPGLDQFQTRVSPNSCFLIKSELGLLKKDSRNERKHGRHTKDKHVNQLRNSMKHVLCVNEISPSWSERAESSLLARPHHSLTDRQKYWSGIQPKTTGKHSRYEIRTK